MEKQFLSKLLTCKNLRLQECGLVMDPQLPFLCVSLDGISSVTVTAAGYWRWKAFDILGHIYQAGCVRWKNLLPGAWWNPGQVPVQTGPQGPGILCSSTGWHGPHWYHSVFVVYTRYKLVAINIPFHQTCWELKILPNAIRFHKLFVICDAWTHLQPVSEVIAACFTRTSNPCEPASANYPRIPMWTLL